MSKDVLVAATSVASHMQIDRPAGRKVQGGEAAVTNLPPNALVAGDEPTSLNLASAQDIVFIWRQINGRYAGSHQP